MAIRRTYQFNTQNSVKGDGILLNQSCDVHGSRTAGGRPWLLDVSFDDRAELGDYPAYKTDSLSLPARIVGGLEGRVRIITAANVATVDDLNILADTTSGNYTLTLPVVATCAGKILFVKNIGANLLSIARGGADTIEGSTTTELSASGPIILFADGANNTWRVHGKSSRVFTLVRENPVSPTRTTVSGTGAILATSAAQYFSGRPCLLTCQVNARDDKAAPEEFFKISYTARFDAGTEFILGFINGGNAGTHINGCFSRILTPTPGIHTVDFLWARSAGAGTMTMDNNDMFQLNCEELN